MLSLRTHIIIDSGHSYGVELRNAHSLLCEAIEMALHKNEAIAPKEEGNEEPAT